MTTDKFPEYNNPTGDPMYDEWYENLVNRELTPVTDEIWDKVSAPPTGSFSKMAEVERNLRRKKD